jgi:hypothetical protein
MFRDRPFDECLDLVVVPDRLFLADHIDLVLDDHDPVDADKFQRHQVLLGLRLGALLGSGDDEHRPVHKRRTGEHGCHKGLVPRGIHKGY